MKKIIFAGFIFSAVFLATFQIVFAHPGRTDSSGGHWNHSTGEYHYHHGYPAHQHVDGVCPYDYDNKTSYNDETSESEHSANPNQSSYSYEDDYEENKINAEEIAACAFVLIPFALILYFFGGKEERNREKTARKIESNKRNTDETKKPSHDVWKLETIIPEYSQMQIPNSDHQQETDAFVNASNSNEKIWSITNNDHLHENTDRQISLDDFNQNQEAYYRKTYSLKTKEEIARMCGMPEGVNLSEYGFPYSYDISGKDAYTFYISKNGKCFHRKKGCGNAYISLNAVQISARKPCKTCKPHIPDLLWYYTYLNVLDNLSRYNIQIKSNDQLPPS